MFSPESIIGKQIDHFRLDELIAGGAIASVYKASDTLFNRTVAIKVIPKMGESTPDSEDARKRLVHEAMAAGRLTHPNIVTIHSYGRTDELEYVCMEYVRGKTLADVLTEKGMLEIEEAAPVFEQVLFALESANQQKITHGNIKPSNIMIREDGRVKVMDFGMLKPPSPSEAGTETSAAFPYYMSPEQISGEDMDIRSDLFSLGAVLYESLTGVKPFQAEDASGVAQKILQTEATPLRVLDGQIPEAIEAFCSKALAREPSQRYQTPWQMLRQLRAAAPDMTVGDQSPSESVLTSRIVSPPEPASEEGTGIEPEVTQLLQASSAAPEPQSQTPPTSSSPPPSQGAPPRDLPKSRESGPRTTALLFTAAVFVIAVYFLIAGIPENIRSIIGGSGGSSQGGAPTAAPTSSQDQTTDSVDSLLAQAESQWSMDPAAARTLIDRASALDPNNAAPALLLARLLSDDGDSRGAIEQYQNALRINPQASEAFCGLGLSYFDLQSYDLAVENYETCWALSPSGRDELMTNLGISYFKKNDLDRARSILEQALAMNPGDELAQSYLSLISQASTAGSTGGQGPQESRTAISPTATPSGVSASGSDTTMAPPPKAPPSPSRTATPTVPSSPDPARQSPAAGAPRPEIAKPQPPPLSSGSPQQPAQVRVGMTQEEVHQILGPPHKIEHEKKHIEWKYYTPKGKTEVKFSGGRVISIK